MASLLKDAKDYYTKFFENGHWSQSKLLEIRFDEEDEEQRLCVIKRVYEIILNSRKSSRSVVSWVTTGLSIRAVAEMLGDNPNNVKSELWYFNQTVGNRLALNGKSILKICISHKEISEEEWKEIYEILNEFALHMGSRVFAADKVLNGKSLLVNIPTKAELHRDITDDEFNELLDLLYPYFTAVRSKTQQLINESRAIGYLNYILTPGVELNEMDKNRQKKVLSYLETGTKKKFKDGQIQKKVVQTERRVQSKEEIEADSNEDDVMVDYGEKIHLRL